MHREGIIKLSTRMIRNSCKKNASLVEREDKTEKDMCDSPVASTSGLTSPSVTLIGSHRCLKTKKTINGVGVITPKLGCLVSCDSSGRRASDFISSALRASPAVLTGC